MGPSLVVEKPDFTDLFIIGTTLTDKFPYNSNDSILYNYATDFDVQWNGSLPFGGKLTLSWSPGASGAEEKVVSGDGISSPAIFTATGESISSMGWFMNKYPLVEHSVVVGPLTDGVHTINFQHTLGNGTFWDWIRLEKPCEQEETAWGFGDRFVDQGNWATFFKYTVELKKFTFIETNLVPSENAVGVTTDHILEEGQLYRFRASGIYTYNNAGDWADAEWYLKSGVVVKGDTEGSTPNVLDVSIDGGPGNIDWGNNSSSHIYGYNYTGEGEPVTFFIHDSNHDDNNGSIRVCLYKVNW